MKNAQLHAMTVLLESLINKYVTGFGKINHFVTFDTSNNYSQNTALCSTS